MIFYLILCNLMLIPIIFCNNITISNLDVTNKTVTQAPIEKLSNVKNVTLLSEGGSILPDTSALALPKLIQSFPNSENEKGNKKVYARKGAFLTNSQEDTSPPNNENSTNKLITTGDKPHIGIEQLNGTTTTTTDISGVKGKSTLLNNITTVPENVNKTEVHKKPTILSYDDVEKSLVKSSSGRTIDDQPHTSISKDVKPYSNANKHPGMVMPIVITILLVPMFAVLGFMALRRGQEAWKNRHYKRMDFLLDGMYND